MTDKLQVVGGEYAYYIAWFDHAEEGARIGDLRNLTRKPEPSDRDEWELWAAERVAKEHLGHGRLISSGYYLWDSRKEAQAVLALIKARIRSPRDLPEWAKIARKNGWKMPKGWKP